MAINGSNVPGTKSLKDFTKSLASLSVPIMEGRTKGDMEALVTEGKAVTLRDYDFLTMDQKGGKKSTFAVIIVDEHPDEFFFTGTVLTDQLTQLDGEGYHDEIAEKGLPMLLSIKKSANGLKYVNVTWYPAV